MLFQLVFAFSAALCVSVLTLVLLRAFAILRKLFWQARQNRFEPHVLQLLIDPNAIGPLEGTRLPFDKVLVETLLLTQAAEIKGRDRQNLTRVFEQLGYVRSEIKKLRSRNSVARMEASVRLGIMLSDEAVPHLIETVRDPVEAVRLAAARSLGQMNQAIGLKVLLDVVAETGHCDVPALLEVVLSLGSSAGLEIGSLLHARQDATTRLLLVQFAGITRAAGAVPTIIDLLSHPDTETRISAARALGQIGDPAAVSALVRTLGDEKAEVRAQVARSLGFLRNSSALIALRGALYDKAWWVRRNAAYALYELGSQGIRVLRETARGSDDLPRAMAAQVLSEKWVVSPDDQSAIARSAQVYDRLVV